MLDSDDNLVDDLVCFNSYKNNHGTTKPSKTSETYSRPSNTACGLEGVGHVRDLPGLAQGVWRLGQIPVPGNPGGIRRQSPIQGITKDLLEAPHHGVTDGRVLRDGFWGRYRGDAGRSVSPHHI